jgi:sugar/nucleoside kinase (ribokinase family)
MLTSLGVSLLLREEHVDMQGVADAVACYATGYLFDGATEFATLDAMVAHAGASNVPVVFDIADPFVVDRNRQQLLEWLPGKVAVLFGNRSELRMLANTEDDEVAIDAALTLAPIVVMKVGSEGAWVRQTGAAAATLVETVAVAAVDTTGAGDSFAAGFLSEWLQHGDPVRGCELGNRVAAQIVGVEGCDYTKADRARV